MKKLFVILLCGCYFLTQAQNDEKKQKINVSLAGGMFAFAGKEAFFTGFLGPKVSTTIQKKKMGYEIGINGFPGLYIPYKGKVTPGLALGGTLILKTKTRIKPCVGIAFTYSQNKWHPMGGIGISF